MRSSDWSSDVCSSDLIPFLISAPYQPVHSAPAPPVPFWPAQTGRYRSGATPDGLLQEFQVFRVKQTPSASHIRLPGGSISQSDGFRNHSAPGWKKAAASSDRDRDRKSTRLNSSH